jgi:alpha-methylacyl-CoA racemase
VPPESLAGCAPLHPPYACYVEIDGIVQPAPAPRFSRTAPDLPIRPQPSGPEQAEAALAAWLDPAEIAALKAAGTLR